MANKLYAMELLTEEVAKDVAANPQEWMRFLNTASRLYRYTFPEQLLIYAQRPGATAVASMEIWNQKMYRWIKKGSKGIALIDNTSGPKTKQHDGTLCHAEISAEQQITEYGLGII